MSREGKRAMRFMVDSGATYSLLPLADWRAIDLAPKRRMTFALADGTFTVEIRPHRIMLGSHSESQGKATRRARRTTSAHMNGSTPLNTVPVDTSGSSVLSTNMFIPTGGLISPISTTHTMM